MSSDPRRAGGSISGPGGPLDRNAVVVDVTNAVILDGTNVCLVEPYRDGHPSSPCIALEMQGRINKTQERAEILYLLNEDGAAALITELTALAARIGPEFYARMKERTVEAFRASGIEVNP